MEQQIKRWLFDPTLGKFVAALLGSWSFMH